MAPRRLSKLVYRVDDSTPSDAGQYGRFVEQVWFEYQAGRVGRVVAALPDLIKNAQRLEDDPRSRGVGWPVSVGVHHLAATLLSKIVKLTSLR